MAHSTCGQEDRLKKEGRRRKLLLRLSQIEASVLTLSSAANAIRIHHHHVDAHNGRLRANFDALPAAGALEKSTREIQLVEETVLQRKTAPVGWVLTSLLWWHLANLQMSQAALAMCESHRILD